MNTTKIKFGVSFRGKTNYTNSEVSHFIECADSVEPTTLRDKYIAFLETFLEGKIKPSTEVDLELLEIFHGDVDNRASIDYREGHWDDDPEICSGGKYFDSIAQKLKSHIAKSKTEKDQ